MSRIKFSSIMSGGVAAADTFRRMPVLGPQAKKARFGLLLLFAAVACLALAPGARAFDPPHYNTANGSADCLRCHMLHGAPGRSLTAVAGNANLCETCHMAGGSASGKPFADADQACPRVGLPAGQSASGTSHRWDSGPAGHVEAVGTVTSTGTLASGGALTGHYAKTYTITITTAGNVGVAAFSWSDTLGGSGTGLVTGTDVALNEGITVTFTDGTPAPSFALGDSWQIPVRPDIAAPMDATLASHLEKGLMMCSTCHDQHEQTLAPFDPAAPAYAGDGTGAGRHYQRIANNINQMCVDCHRARNVTSSSDGSHPVGVTVPAGEFKAPTNLPLDATGKVVCMTCHQPHFAASTDGSLLLVSDANSLCTDCHTNCNTGTGAHFSPATGVLWPGGQYGSTFPQITDASKKGMCVNCHQPHGWPDNLDPTRDYAKLLVERTHNDPQGDETLCYTCHDADGPSTKNVKDEYAEAIHHPVKTSEQVPGREVKCTSCHNVHKAQSGAHDYNATADANRHNVPNPLQGAPGLAVDFTGVGNFLPVPANHFTPITKATGATYEYQVCFQCHTGNGFPTTSTGTVTLTNGDTNVVGAGTAWTSDLVGSTLFHTGDSAFYVVTAVADATHLRLNAPYSGTTASGASYSIQTPGPRLTALFEAATSGKGANFTANSRTVTGTGTAWTSNLIGSLMWRQGDLQQYVIDSVQSATSLTLESPYVGATGANARYSIWAPSDATAYIDLANTATFTNASTQVTAEGQPVTFTTGAVALANGSENVAGTGTAWNEAVVGGLFQRLGDTAVYRVSAFNSPTSISITPVYAGASVSNQAFTITTTMPYTTGSVAVTNGGTTVTGTGTAWSAAFIGALLQIDGTTAAYTVTAVNSATSLTISPAYAGATASGQVYTLATGLFSMGTADFTNGSTNLTGTGTLWVPAHVGALIQRTGDTTVYRIATFTDSSHITIAPAYAGTTALGAQFTLAPMTYSTGTVAVTNGSGTVTGTGTTFAATHVGGLFEIAGDTTAYTVTAFTNATTITISPVYAGTTSSGNSYTISNKAYNTGTVAVTNGSATVTGTGTTWLTAYVGSMFQRTGDSQVYTVVGRASNTSITISPAYAGVTGSGAAYTLTAWQFSPGTVALTNGSATVTGTGTPFAASMVGGLFQRTGDTAAYTITAYTSATSITIAPVYAGTTGASLGYTIVPGFINSGTAACANGSTTVTGTGTIWTAMVIGSTFQMVGDPNKYTVVNWTDATHLVIYPAYSGSASGPYTLTMGMYSLGTAAFTNGSATVAGTGATWTAPLLGGAIQLNGDPVAYTIAGIADAAHITLDRPYAGTTASGAYTINSGRTDILSAGSQATYGAETFCKVFNTGTASFTNGSATVTGLGTSTSVAYTTGTVGLTNGSPTVTGTGTTWTAAHVGGMFQRTGDAAVYTITARASNTSITISPVYGGTTVASGATYTITTALYNLGTVAVTNGGTSVTGTNTNWTSVLVGGRFLVTGDATLYTVTAAPSATSLTISPAFAGTTASGLAYTINNGATIWSMMLNGGIIQRMGDTTAYTIVDVPSATSLTVAPAFAGTTGPGLYTVKFGSKAGMWIRANSETATYKVASVENPTTLTLASAYTGSAAPNQAFALTAATDLSQEFNPNNLSGHPIVTGLNNFTNSLAPKALNASQMKAPWDVNMGNQTMMCSDCHNTDAASGAAQGPHGSAAQFMLRGANAANWPNVPLQDFDESWCANCHEEGVNGGHEDSPHKGWPCYYCHIVIPHGGKVSRLIATQTPGMPARYAYNNDLSNVHVVLFTKASETGYAGGSCKVTGNQGAHSGTSTGEKW